jgi:hypothetical protein
MCINVCACTYAHFLNTKTVFGDLLSSAYFLSSSAECSSPCSCLLIMLLFYLALISFAISPTPHLFASATEENQGCQMVCFQTKSPNLGKLCGALDWKMFTYFMANWNILTIW